MKRKFTALEYLKSYIKKEYPNEDYSVSEYLYDSEPIYKEDLGDSRWWSNYFLVSEIGGVLIGYNGATTTGDESPKDVGWEFNEDDVCYVERVEKTKIVVSYIRK